MNKNIAHWIVVNGIFILCMLFGYIGDINGFKNIALFMAWMSIIASFLTPDVFDRLYTKGTFKLSVPLNVIITFDIIILSIFVWYNATFTAIMYTIQILLIMHIYKKVEKRREEK